MKVTALGEARYPSPLDWFTAEDLRLPVDLLQPGEGFELAGPRRRLYFEPGRTRAAIVTCGGLCPGLNNVIRSAYLELHHRYGLHEVYGIRYGYAGLDPARRYEPLLLTPAVVEDIHKQGGTLLGTSRGPVPPDTIVNFLRARDIGILLCVGGDGTLRCAHAIATAALAKGYELAVVGVPKTIDNDVPFADRTFGFLTAIEGAAQVIDSAHNEARAHDGGIGLVKLMGRHAGFIAAGATLASQEVNFTLIPEAPFSLAAFLEALTERIRERRHAVIVVAEGAGQELMAADRGRDASGNKKLGDIGLFLKAKIEDHFTRIGGRISLKYIDPSYIIRSRPANTADALLCDLYARHAVHAAMAGSTDVMVGLRYDTFVHVPLAKVTAERKQIAPEGREWRSVLAATGQPVLDAAPRPGA